MRPRAWPSVIRNKESALVLLSGGIDSAIVALIAAREKSQLIFLTFDYQQVNRKELLSAKAIAKFINPRAKHFLYRLDFSIIARSKKTYLLSDLHQEEKRKYGYYVPGRNLIFLSHAASVAEAYDTNEIYIGSNFQDAPSLQTRGFRDSGQAFLASTEQTIRAGSLFNSALKIKAPLLSMTKFELIRYGFERGFDFGMTWSCYWNERLSCGECTACQTRLFSFHWAGLKDPLPYAVPFNDALEKALAAYS